MHELMNLCSAFGLSTASGLNAYIPLLTVSVMANRGIIKLAPPFDVMGTWWCITILVILLIVEVVVDKIPGADHVNDMVMTVVRPVAGAILFASQAGVITSVHPAVWIVIGLLCAGAVHATKAVARPVVNVTTAGMGAPVVSVVEDLVSAVLAIVAILVPILAVVLVGIFGFLMFKLFKKMFWRKRAVGREVVEVKAFPVVAGGVPQGAGWGGGV